MPKFKFELPAPLDSATTYGKIKTHLSGENDFKKFDPKVVCTFDEPSKSAKLKGNQYPYQAELHVHGNGQASLVAVEVEVPLAMLMFKGKIKEILEKNLKRIL